MSTEFIFEVEQESDGGYIASALGEAIATEGDTLDELKANIRQVVNCHFAGRDPSPRTVGGLAFRFKPQRH